MQFNFHQPIYWGGRIAGEIEMMAELSGSPDDPSIDALYAIELAPGYPRYEIKPGTPEFDIAKVYLQSNPQELARITDEWPEDETPRVRSVISEHSTYYGRPS
jgi:hypothetical protein